MPVKRSERVAALLREIIGETITQKMYNPDAAKATVNHVDITDNLRHVKVYVSVNGDEKQRAATMAALLKATGFIKHEIAAQSTLKFVPEVVFIYDDTLDQLDNIGRLLRSLKNE